MSRAGCSVESFVRPARGCLLRLACVPEFGFLGVIITDSIPGVPVSFSVYYTRCSLPDHRFQRSVCLTLPASPAPPGPARLAFSYTQGLYFVDDTYGALYVVRRSGVQVVEDIDQARRQHVVRNVSSTQVSAVV